MNWSDALFRPESVAVVWQLAQSELLGSSPRGELLVDEEPNVLV